MLPITWCASQLCLYELLKYLSGFLLQSDCLIQVKTIGTARRDLAKGDRDRLIEVKITAIKGSNFRDFDNSLLNRV